MTNPSTAWETTAPKRVSWAKRHPVWLACIVGVAALLIGIGAGGESTDDDNKDTPAAATEPVVRTETVTNEVVPASCIEALEQAERIDNASREGFAISARAMELMSDALSLAGEVLSNPLAAELYVDDMEAISPQIRDETDKFEVVKTKLELARGNYADAAADCRERS